MQFVALHVVAFFHSRSRLFTHSAGNVLECTSKRSCTHAFYIAFTKSAKKHWPQNKSGAVEKKNWTVNVSDIECANGFFPIWVLMWKKNTEIILFNTASHTMRSSVYVRSLVRICNTHFAYSSTQRTAPQSLRLYKNISANSFSSALFFRFLARATKLISPSEIFASWI